MGGKLSAAALGLVLALPTVPSSSHERHIAVNKRDRYVVRTFGPPSRYAPVEVKALFDSCWRYREILTSRRRELERIWTCGNYISLTQTLTGDTALRSQIKPVDTAIRGSRRPSVSLTRLPRAMRPRASVRYHVETRCESKRV